MFDAPIYICVQNMAFRIVIGINSIATFITWLKHYFETHRFLRFRCVS
jgi:hypothetical protein